MCKDADWWTIILSYSSSIDVEEAGEFQDCELEKEGGRRYLTVGLWECSRTDSRAREFGAMI